MGKGKRIITHIVFATTFAVTLVIAVVFGGSDSDKMNSAPSAPSRSLTTSKASAMTPPPTQTPTPTPQQPMPPTSEPQTQAPQPQPRSRTGSLPAPLRGVTLDSVENLDASVSLIRSSPQKLTVRLVMDREETLATYRKAVEALHPHAYVMVQILDSNEMPSLSAQEIRKRTRDAVTAFGDKVDLWEIGNELNGSWVGSSPEAINAKAAAAHEVVKSSGGRTAVTLNYWSSHDCYEHDWEATLPYAKKMPKSLRSTDYVFLSIYETACDPPQHPSAADIAKTLNSLGKLFPHAQLGIGEVGVQDESDGMESDTGIGEKRRIATYYYGMQTELESKVGVRYVGGYFWWYFHKDAVQPALGRGEDGSLWPTIKSLTSEL